MESRSVSTGIPSLDDVLQGLRLGDNVVWQVDSLSDYVEFVRPFAERSLADGRQVVYLRFADHAPVLSRDSVSELIEVDPQPGFDVFSREVHSAIEARGRKVFYVFDNLSALVAEWATDELLANFFQVTCPYLFELDTVTYFALTRGKHAHSAVARIRDTTQLLLDTVTIGGRTIVHPVKVWDRYTPTMFLPHVQTGDRWVPVFRSGEAAALNARAPLGESPSPIAPWSSVYDRLKQYRGTQATELASNAEVSVLKQELCRMVLGNHPEFARLADRYFTLDDLLDVRHRLIGSGRIGGKAAGMLLARCILLSAEGNPRRNEFAAVLEPHDSFFIGSDVFFTFLVDNNLFRLRLHVSRESRMTHGEFEDVERRFLEGRFPPAILEQFRTMLDYFGQAPIIVRSSSLLEDSFGNAFAGKYRSEFCVNQGDSETRLAAFVRAVKLVYASAVNPDALSYRRKRGLGDSDEQMAILVQRVSGMPHGKYFFPSVAGVAFSRNLYAWCDRIDPSRGILRIVFGLGTRAVDRVGGDYPRMVPVSQPLLRPEIGMKVAKYSQKLVDLLDLEANALATVPFTEVVEKLEIPNLGLYVSVLRDGWVEDPVTRWVDAPPSLMVLTFNKLIKQTDLVRILGSMLERLDQAYGRPIDTEITAGADGAGYLHVNLLQCRPLFLPGESAEVRVPADLPRGRVLFRADRMICGGVVRRIRYILYIDPAEYDALDLSKKKSLGRLVGRINHKIGQAGDSVMMMGPGRWGSSNIELGVNVGYADIDRAAVLVEIAREEAGHVPEVSYGTHFFQDLVEDRVIYLPVYPDDPATQFNREFFAHSPNAAHSFLSEVSGDVGCVHLIDVPAASGGSYANAVADTQSRQAVCFLD